LNKVVYRITTLLAAFVLVFGNYSVAEAAPEPADSDVRVYAYYYLWWSDKHWQDKLGPNYPYDSSPLPLPAKTDADGCNPASLYTGNELIDVPSALWSQDDPGQIERDIRTAKNAGISGFWLNWGGDGTTSQTRSSVTYTRRLSEAFAASARVGGFTNWVSYKTSSKPSADEIINDLNFLYAEFKNESAWEKIDGRPVVTLTGSRKYGDAALAKISSAVRDRLFLVGDESGSTLTDARLALVDGLTYYWSSQNPYSNPRSFDTIIKLGDKVHAAGKRWYAPVAPGYNSNLIGGSTCVPRKGGETMRKIWEGNAASNPDGWGLISWNEIAENSHIQPMQKWGNTYTDVLSGLIRSTGSATAPTNTPWPEPTATQYVSTPTNTVQPQPTSTFAPEPTAIKSEPTPTESAVPPSASSGGTMDDKDGLFVYSSPAWQSVNTSKAYGGSYMETSKSGSYVEFEITGQSFSVIYKGGKTFSEFKVYVDGMKVATLDQKMAVTSYQQRWDYPGQLAPGTHIVRLTFTAKNSKINRGSLDAVIVR